MTATKAYPTDPRGEVDAGWRRMMFPKPCARRIDHANELEGALHTVTWCTLKEAHTGQCSGPPPRVLERNDHMPRRK